jgi:hypothetical protein
MGLSLCFIMAITNDERYAEVRMAPNDGDKSLRDKHDPAWRALASFWLANEPGSERLAAERVETAVRELAWPVTNLASIGQAVVRAARSAQERGPSGARLVVRLFVRAVGAAAIVDTPPAASGLRGGGFFLVQRDEDRSSPLADAKDTMIELFLYQE